MHDIIISEVIQIRNITLRVSDDFHYSVKTFATKKGISLQSYMVETVERDLKENKAFVKSPESLAELMDDLSEEDLLEVLKRVREEKRSKK